VRGATNGIRENHLEAVQETGNLIASDKVQGTNVCNAAGDNLGSIHDIMIDKPSGTVAYAIMSFGGSSGSGTSITLCPGSVLRYDSGKGGYVVVLDKRQLEGAPFPCAAESGRRAPGAFDERQAQPE
jgi:PRC-barrel domain